MMKKLVSFLLALSCVLPCAAACGSAGGTTSVDSGSAGTGGASGEEIVYGQYNNPENKDNKVVLSFHNSGGGVGKKWIEVAAETYAKENKDTVFSNGKTGVYIDIHDSMGYDVNNLASSTFDVLVGEGFVFNFAAKDLLLNLDSVVKDESREGGSIEANLVETPKQGALYNGSYYGIPFLEYYPGLSYNHEVFEKRGYFIAEGENGIAFTSKFSSTPVYFTNDVTKKSLGSDGIAGTEDDGLPVSMEQFLALMEKIDKDGQYAPVLLSGKVTNYSNYFAIGLMGSLAGKEQMTNLMNGSGEVEIVVREGSGDSVELTDENLFPGIDYIKKPKTTTITLNAQNGYKGTDLAARYYANAIFEIMEHEGWWSQDVGDTNRDHIGAQLAFLVGKNGSGAREKAAMLVEASYWMTEARDANLGPKVETGVGKKLEDVDVRTMSLPTCFYTADATTETPAFVSMVNSYLLANKRLESDPVKKEVALDFIAFLNTEKQLQEYTVISGMARSMKYDLPAADENGDIKLTCSDGNTYTFASYYQHLWNLRKADGSNIIYAASNSESFIKNCSSLYLNLTQSPLFYNPDGDRPNPYSVVKKYKTLGAFNYGTITQSAWKI